ncbi:protein TIFY 5A-like [Magnolia sinica]|uniref:protein TIFY 5A-like n=1 Tax=Magnolia sinica TaxID=86752 RepID=UPI00265A6036|nr:protein TIFY 5A-like [Magnolia sinica]
MAIESQPSDLSSMIGYLSSSVEKTSKSLTMDRNCNLELRLLPAGVDADLPSADSGPSSSDELAQNSQQLTIFYNGRICICDVTEIQAREILCLVNREMHEKLTARHMDPLPPSQQPQPRAPALSMRRSLQRFLQKRKTRILTTSPYKQ